jgi:hypothetical protein
MESVARRLEEEFPEHKQEFVPRICRPTIIVDRKRMFPDVVVAGRFGQVDPRILRGDFRFSGEGVQAYEWKLFEFPASTLEDVEMLIEKESPDNSWIPAGTEELLSFAEQVSDQEQRDIIIGPRAKAMITEPARALFDGTKGEEETALFAIQIFGSAPIRILGLSKVVGKFPSRFKFLGVRKLPGPCHCAQDTCS